MAGRDLTPMQYLVLAHFANGHSLAETAQAIGIKPQTAKNHAKEAFIRLRVSNRWQAFEQLGWLHPPDVRR